MALQVPIDLVFEKPSHSGQLLLWSTAIHLLNLVYNMDWDEERTVHKELQGVSQRLEETIKEIRPYVGEP